VRAFPAIVEAYLEELGFLAVQRRALLCATDVTRAQFDEHVARLEAHLDGVRHAAEDARGPAEAVLAESGEEWELYGAARAWLESAPRAAEEAAAWLDGEPRAPAGAEDEPEAPDPAAAAAARAAWTEALRGWARPLARWPQTPAGAAAALAAAAWAGPLPMERVEAAAAAPEPVLRRAAARALGAAGETAAGGRARALLESLAADADPGVSAVALWGLCLADPAGAAPRLRGRLAAEPPPLAVRALGLFGDERDVESLDLLARSGTPARRAAALRALGDLGFAKTLPTVLAALDAAEEEVAAAAADAYFALTGKEVETVVPDEAPPPPGDEDEEEEAPEPPEDAAGPIPPDAPDEEEAPEAAPQRNVAAARAAAPKAEGRLRLGRAFGDADDMAWHWRRAVTAPRAGDAWLRREVPAGWFDGLTAGDMRAGE